MAEPDRRKFPRLRAPVLWRRSGQPHGDRREALNVGAGGIHIYADAPHTPGERLELNLFLPDHCWRELKACRKIPTGLEPSHRGGPSPAPRPRTSSLTSPHPPTLLAEAERPPVAG